MTRVSFLFRGLIALAAVGMALGGLVMLAEGMGNLGEAVTLMREHAGAHAVVGMVMHMTDEFLFSAVLVIFAANLLFGFALPDELVPVRSVPQWMRSDGVQGLKTSFGQAIIVYLAVDFATDIAGGEELVQPWTLPLLPLSILLLAAAFRVLPKHAEHGHEARPEAGHDH